MAYIKIIKDEELVGGVDNTDVYPVTTSQAVYRQSEGKPTVLLETSLQNMEDTLKSVPINRGDYTEGERYYEGNLVQYKGGTYIAHTNDYITEPPFYINPEELNPGWDVFARGYNSETSEGVTNVAWDDNRKVLTQVKKNVSYDIITAQKLKEEVSPKFVYSNTKESINIENGVN